MNLALANLLLIASPAGHALPAEALVPTPVVQETTQFSFEAPSIYVPGEPFPVTVEIEAGSAQAPVAAWLLKESAFLIDGQSVGARTSDQFLTLAPGSVLTLAFDLAPFMDVEADFDLAYGNAGGTEPIRVSVLQRAPSDLDFMAIDEAELGKYMIVVNTNRGTMLWEMWPHVAPGHVRNFLDLYSSGFYDETLFHRVGPGFMIQGGDPNTKDPALEGRWGTGGGPRQLKAEFSDKPHVRGTLSTARSQSPDSGSSQFFVMHGRAASLDGQYTVFGQLYADHAESFRVLDAIATSEMTRGRDGTGRPNQPQRIERAAIVIHPNPPAFEKREMADMEGEAGR